MVLADDNFATIVEAVREGRAIFSNIKKSIFFLLSSNAGLCITVFVTSFFKDMAPLSPLQILWINLVTNGLPALALGVDPPEADQMTQPPREPGEPFLHAARLGRHPGRRERDGRGRGPDLSASVVGRRHAARDGPFQSDHGVHRARDLPAVSRVQLPLGTRVGLQAGAAEQPIPDRGRRGECRGAHAGARRAAVTGQCSARITIGPPRWFCGSSGCRCCRCRSWSCRS